MKFLAPVEDAQVLRPISSQPDMPADVMAGPMHLQGQVPPPTVLKTPRKAPAKKAAAPRKPSRPDVAEEAADSALQSQRAQATAVTQDLVEGGLAPKNAAAAGAASARAAQVDQVARELTKMAGPAREQFLWKLASTAGPDVAEAVAKKAGISTKLMGLRAAR